MTITIAGIAIAALLGNNLGHLDNENVFRTEAAAQETDTSRYVGTWQKEGGDSGATQKITLLLRADGSYRKTLRANVGGVPYGGTHEGTWTAKGSVVSLSGDGKWPASSHNLSEFRKID